MSLRSLSPLSLFALLACGGDPCATPSDSADTGGDPLMKLQKECPEDTGQDSASGSDDSGGPEEEPEPEEEGLVELTDPCEGAGTPYGLLFTSEDDGWLGCGNGMGLWRTSDGGETWDRGHPSEDLYIFQLALDAEGRLLACGRDYETAADDALLYRYDGEDWETLLRYGNHDDDPAAAYLSNCGVAGGLGDGRLVAASATAGDLVWSEDDGLTWSETDRYWEEQNLDDGGYSYYYLLNIVAMDDAWFGAGSKIDEPPVFFGASDHPDADWYNLAATVIDDGVEGEVWALATPDEGKTWLAGGRDQSDSDSASGFLYRSEDGGESWESIELGGDLDIVHDLVLDPTTGRGVAVGHRYPTSHGGFALLTEDSGQSWFEIDADLPLLQSAAVSGDRWWIAGDGYLGGGSW